MAKIRIWKLGSLEHRMLPTPEAIKKFQDILNNIEVGEDVDLAWGPDIDVLVVDNSEECKELLDES